MAYKSLIDRNLNLAFRLLKDLAVNVKFVRKQGVGFNFGTGEALSSPIDSEVIAKVVFTDAVKASEEHNTKTRSLMVKSKDIGDLKNIDYIEYEGKRWKINPEIKDTGFILMLKVSREV